MQSSRHFAVALIIFEDEEQEEEASQRIQALRQELHTPNIEFHVVKNKNATRIAFLNAVKDLSFTVTVLVADKTRLLQPEFREGSTFYKLVCAAALEQARPLLHNADIWLGDSGGEKFKKGPAAYLRKRLNSQEEKVIKSIGAGKSSGTFHNSSLIQLADMVCGAVYRSLQEGQDADEYRRIIQHRLNVVSL